MLVSVMSRKDDGYRAPHHARSMLGRAWDATNARRAVPPSAMSGIPFGAGYGIEWAFVRRSFQVRCPPPRKMTKGLRSMHARARPKTALEGGLRSVQANGLHLERADDVADLNGTAFEHGASGERTVAPGDAG
jgi:hypothetical protein